MITSCSRWYLGLDCSAAVIAAAADPLPLAADGWFNVVAGRCLYGATVDGMGGDGDDEVSG